MPDVFNFINLQQFRDLIQCDHDHCESIMRKCFNERCFIKYAFNNYVESYSNKCISSFLHLCFNELLDNYKILNQVVKNDYTKIIEYDGRVHEVKYLQVYENRVKYTLKMWRFVTPSLPNALSGYGMNIKLKITSRNPNEFDNNYKSISVYY